MQRIHQLHISMALLLAACSCLVPGRALAQPRPAGNDPLQWGEYEHTLTERWKSGQIIQEQLELEVHAALTSPQAGVRHAALKALPPLKEKGAFALEDL